VKRIHCSYHKCLTMYYEKVLLTLYTCSFWRRGGYRHFTSYIDEFYQHHDEYAISSINNHVLDFKKLGDDFRLTRFVRDPRDLVVSGFFYHRKGTESWSTIVDPKAEDWKGVNGSIPENMGKGHSYASFLQELSIEEGLIAEIDFRKKHFQSMNQWPLSDPRIKLFRYEDILGNERVVFAEIFSHYGFTWPKKWLGVFLADQFSAKKQAATRHIRNPGPGQWKKYFSPKVQDYFMRQYGGILDRYHYA